MSLNSLLISDEIIKERTGLHTSTDAKFIYPDIKTAQDMYILPVLGTALFDKLQAAVNADDWTGLGDYKSLMDNYIIDALMYFTLAELPFSLGFQFWNKGVVRKLGENTELPSMSDLVDISNRNRDKGQHYANRLMEYLKQNANAKFPEYLQPGNGIDTVNPNNKGFSISIYLGGDDCDCCGNPGGFTRKPYSG